MKYILQDQMNDYFTILKNCREVSSQHEAQQIHNIALQKAQKKRFIKPRQLRDKKAGKGKWSKKEQINYINFLEHHYDIMKSADKRKSMKIFTQMSKNIRSRVSQQCRSHHQKMKELHRSVKEIIRFFKQEVFPLDNVEAKRTQTMKTDVKVQFPLFDGLYRMTIHANNIKIEINSDLIVSY